jgi:hypothetical protein
MKQKTTKLILIIFALVIVPFTIHAQLDNFKLKNYKLPDLKRQGIDLNFGINGGYYSFKYIEMEGDHTQASFDSDLTGNYFLF